jgi:hypothetical protein
MDLLNGHDDRLPAASLDQLLRFNLMVVCFAPPTTLCIHKNAGLSTMARIGCCMPRALAIVGAVNCEQSVRKTAPP